jgi:hypothetical protein
MSLVFGIASTLLAVLALGRFAEIKAHKEVAPGLRDMLDGAVLITARGVLRGLHRLFDFIRRDVVARLLHLLSVVLLVLVRYLERHLAQVVTFFRGSRDKRRSKTSRRLAHLERSTGTDDAVQDTDDVLGREATKQ